MIETERLILRPHTLDDFDAAFAMQSDPEVMRFITTTPMSREDSWNRLLRYAGHWALLGYGLFAIVDKATGRFLGETGIADFHRGLGERFDPFGEAAWILAGSAHGKGIASEAAAAAHKWFDAARAQTRTVCIINPANAASLRVAGELGYVTFGRAPYRGGSVVMLERVASSMPSTGAMA